MIIIIIIIVIYYYDYLKLTEDINWTLILF